MFRGQLACASALLLLVLAWPLSAQESVDVEPTSAPSLEYFAPLAGVWKSKSFEKGEERVEYTMFRLRDELNAVDIVQLSADPTTKLLKSAMRGFIGVPSGTNQIQGLFFGSDGFWAEAVGTPTDGGVLLKGSGVGPEGRRVYANIEYVFGDGDSLTTKFSDMITPMGYTSEAIEVKSTKTGYDRIWGAFRDGAIVVPDEGLPEPPGIFQVTRPLGGRWRVVDQEGNTQLELNWRLAVMNRWVTERWENANGQNGINVTGVDPETRQLALWSINAQNIGRSGYWEVLEDGAIAQVEGRSRLVRRVQATDSGEEQFHAHWQRMRQGRFVDTDEHYVAIKLQEEESNSTSNGSWQDEEWAKLTGVWRATEPGGRYRIKRITRGQEVLELYEADGTLVREATTDMKLERHGGINFFSVRNGTPQQYTSIYKVHDGKWYEQLHGIFADAQGAPNAFIIYDKVEEE